MGPGITDELPVAVFIKLLLTPHTPNTHTNKRTQCPTQALAVGPGIFDDLPVAAIALPPQPTVRGRITLYCCGADFDRQKLQEVLHASFANASINVFPDVSKGMEGCASVGGHTFTSCRGCCTRHSQTRQSTCSRM